MNKSDEMNSIGTEDDINPWINNEEEGGGGGGRRSRHYTFEERFSKDSSPSLRDSTIMRKEDSIVMSSTEEQFQAEKTDRKMEPTGRSESIDYGKEDDTQGPEFEAVTLSKDGEGNTTTTSPRQTGPPLTTIEDPFENISTPRKTPKLGATTPQAQKEVPIHREEIGIEEAIQRKCLIDDPLLMSESPRSISKLNFPESETPSKRHEDTDVNPTSFDLTFSVSFGLSRLMGDSLVQNRDDKEEENRIIHEL
jgi:hypothetical protein